METHHPNSIRVLVIEDDPLDAKLMEMSLTFSLECVVIVVNSREGFVLELEHATPDVVISDSNVPSFTGAAARELVLDHCPHVPFIFYSGASAEALADKAAKLGAQGWLQKKDLDCLGDLVRQVCGLKK